MPNTRVTLKRLYARVSLAQGGGGGGGTGYVLPPATNVSLGGVIVGNGISVSPVGLISVNLPTSVPTVTANAQPNITSLGTLTGLTVAGTITSNGYSGDGGGLSNITAGNIVGSVPTAGTAGTVTTPAQPNITSVGTLQGLNVAGNITGTFRGTAIPSTSNLGPVQNVTITGGASGQVLTTDGTGNLTWQSGAGYVLPQATPTILGGIKLGNNLSTDANGLTGVSGVVPAANTAITVTGADQPNIQTLPSLTTLTALEYVQRTVPNYTLFQITASGAGGLISVGVAGIITTSNDGFSWVNSSNPLNETIILNGVATDNLGFSWAGGSNGTLLRSTDNTGVGLWTTINAGTTNNINGVFFFANTIILVCDGGQIRYNSGTSASPVFVANNLPSASYATGIAYSGSLFVAVNNSGQIYTSSQINTTWTQRNAGIAGISLNEVIWANNRFIAVGQNTQGNGVILTSPDGINWSSQVTGVINAIRDIAYGNNTYVGVGDNGYAITSTNAVNWTPMSIGNNTNVYGIVFTMGRFFAVGTDGVNYVSSDGIVWSIPGGYKGSGYYLTSLNGANVSGGVNFANVANIVSQPIQPNITSLGTLTSLNVNGIAQLGNVANVKITGGTNGYVLGTDGTGNLSWVVGGGGGGSGVPGGSNSQIQYNNGGMFAGDPDLTYNHTTGVLQVGGPWQTITSGTTTRITRLLYNGSRYVGVGQNGLIITSTNGTTWTSTSPTTANLNGILWTGSQWIAVGGDSLNTGYITTSPDGITWTPQTITSQALYGIATDGTRYITVGNNGQIFSSTNGTAWTAASSGVTNSLRAITFGEATWVAVGDSGQILASINNGITWLPRTSGVASVFNDVLYANSQFIAIGDGGSYSISQDGIVWGAGSIGASTNLYGISFGNFQYIMVGAGGNIFRSTNGSTWSNEASITNQDLWAVALGQSFFYVAGANGTINYRFPATTSINPLGIMGTNLNVVNTTFQKFQETIIPTVTVTNGQVITPDLSMGTIFRYTLTGNFTLNTFLNATAGSSATIILTQDATGSRLMTSTMKFSGISRSLSTAANAVDIMFVFYDGINYYASLGKGYV